MEDCLNIIHCFALCQTLKAYRERADPHPDHCKWHREVSPGAISQVNNYRAKKCCIKLRIALYFPFRYFSFVLYSAHWCERTWGTGFFIKSWQYRTVNSQPFMGRLFLYKYCILPSPISLSWGVWSPLEGRGLLLTYDTSQQNQILKRAHQFIENTERSGQQEKKNLCMSLTLSKAEFLLEMSLNSVRNNCLRSSISFWNFAFSSSFHLSNFLMPSSSLWRTSCASYQENNKPKLEMTQLERKKTETTGWF